jgi:hypothetical protein
VRVVIQKLGGFYQRPELIWIWLKRKLKKVGEREVIVGVKGNIGKDIELQ